MYSDGKNIIWKRMIYHGKDLGDYYLVSNTGEIKGVKTGKIRKKNINHEGYYYVSVSLGSRDNKPYIKIHRAVAETFLNNLNNYPVINHIDGNKLNNNVNNLEFCTYTYNSQHALANELINRYCCAKKIVCITTGKVINSIMDAGKLYGCRNTNISNYLCNKNMEYAGKLSDGTPLKWMYYEDFLKLPQEEQNEILARNQESSSDGSFIM